MKNFILSLLFVSILVSCGTGTLSCTDADVTQLAKEIFEGENNSVYSKVLRPWLVIKTWNEIGQEEKAEIKAKIRKRQPDVNLDGLNWLGESTLKGFWEAYFVDEDDELNAEYDRLYKLIWKEHVSYNLVNIRPINLDEEIKKCECEAEIEFYFTSEGMDALGIDAD